MLSKNKKLEKSIDFLPFVYLDRAQMQRQKFNDE